MSNWQMLPCLALILILAIGKTEGQSCTGDREFLNATSDGCVTCAFNEYYDDEDMECAECPPDTYSIFGEAATNPNGSDSCQALGACSEEKQERCHICFDPPYNLTIEYPTSASAEIPLQVCLCRRGFALVEDEDGPICKRHCEIENGACSQLCEEEEGSEEGDPSEYECACRDGYELADDEETCIPVNLCLDPENRCHPPHQCVPFNGGYKCLCAAHHVSTHNSTQCRRVDGMACTVVITPPSSLEEDLPVLELIDDIGDHIEGMMQATAIGNGMPPPPLDFEVNYADGAFEIHLLPSMSDEVPIEDQARLLQDFDRRLQAQGYEFELDPDSEEWDIIEPVTCFSGDTLGRRVRISDGCNWLKYTGHCLLDSFCAQDNGIPRCTCQGGRYGNRCQYRDVTAIDIINLSLTSVIGLCLICILTWLCLSRGVGQMANRSIVPYKPYPDPRLPQSPVYGGMPAVVPRYSRQGGFFAR